MNVELSRRVECTWAHATGDDRFSLDDAGAHDDELDVLGVCVVWNPREGEHAARAVAVRQGHIRDHIHQLQGDNNVRRENDDLYVTWAEVHDHVARESVERYLVRMLRPTFHVTVPSGPSLSVNLPWPFDRMLNLPDNLKPEDIQRELHAYQERKGLPSYFPAWCMDALAGSHDGYIVYGTNDLQSRKHPTFGAQHFPTRKRAEDALSSQTKATVVLVHVIEHEWEVWHQKRYKTEKKTGAVGIYDLQVILAPDGDGWIAQCLELDYAAEGSSPNHARYRFERGLRALLRVHMERFGSIEKVVAPPKRDLATDLLLHAQSSEWSHTELSAEFLPRDVGFFPFKSIKYALVDMQDLHAPAPSAGR